MIYHKLPVKIEKIFIDLDDTFVDFVGAAYELMGGPKVATTADYNKFWDFLWQDGRQDELWSRIIKKGPQWWTDLKKLEWADELWKVANEACDDVIFLSSPGSGKYHGGAEIAAHGKIMWSVKHYKENMLVLAYRKYMCSYPGALLIDDWGKYIEPWEQRGGKALHLRRPWHDSGHYPEEIIETLRKYARLNGRR